MSAQLEDGYTPIAHELLEALSKTRINGSQSNIIFFIFRYTYGFHRKCHEMGNSFIAEGTAIRKDQVKKELSRLIDLKIVKVFEESSHIKSRVIGINTRTDEWEINKKTTQGVKNTPGIELPTSQGAKTTPPPGGQLPPQDIYSFKNNFKDITDTTKPPEIILQDEFCRIHEKGDWTLKQSEFQNMQKITRMEIPLDFIINTMSKIFDHKKSKSEKVTSFNFYLDPIVDAWNAKNGGQAIGGNGTNIGSNQTKSGRVPEEWESLIVS